MLLLLLPSYDCLQKAAAAEHTQSRRAALASLAGIAALLSNVSPSLAAFGDSANIFGRVTNKSGFIPYAGEGFATVIPSKWNPSSPGYLQEFPGMLIRCGCGAGVVDWIGNT